MKNSQQYLGSDFAPCHSREDYVLYKRGRLGVAISPQIFADNVRDLSENDLVKDTFEDIKNRLGPHSMIYFPECGEQTFIVEVRGHGSKFQRELAVRRRLACKILRVKANHGINYQIEETENFTRASAIPVIITSE